MLKVTEGQMHLAAPSHQGWRGCKAAMQRSAGWVVGRLDILLPSCKRFLSSVWIYECCFPKHCKKPVVFTPLSSPIRRIPLSEWPPSASTQLLALFKAPLGLQLCFNLHGKGTQAPILLPSWLPGCSDGQFPFPASLRLLTATPAHSPAPMLLLGLCTLCTPLLLFAGIFQTMNSSRAGQTVCNYNIFAGRENRFLANPGEHRRQRCWGGWSCNVSCHSLARGLLVSMAGLQRELTWQLLHTALSTQSWATRDRARGTPKLHPGAHRSDRAARGVAACLHALCCSPQKLLSD